MITYSQTDLLKFPSREEFGKCIKTVSTKDLGKLKYNTGLAPMKNITMVETTIMLL